MKKHIVCLGDSNTHGYCADPADCVDGGIRFTEEQRWTKLLQKHLGDDYLVIEEGLSGRTTCFEDPLHEGLSALNYIYPCLKSHEFVDLLVIMLVSVDVAVLVLAQTGSFTISSEVVVAETVIVGDVPGTFLQTGGDYEFQTEN